MFLSNIKPRFSTYLHSLYGNSKKNKTPFFVCESNRIHIIQDPLQYYTAIIKGIKKSYRRVGLSALYLGTGTLERYLLMSLENQAKNNPQLKTTMVYDYSRSLRKQHGQSGYELLQRYYHALNRKNVHIGFYKNHYIPGKLAGILGQILGVHHQKICIFDDDVIIGGANLSQSYFLNRIDRYMQFSQVPDLADYLFDYLQVLSQNSYVFQENSDYQTKQKMNTLQQHYKLWKFGNTSETYQQSIFEQEQKINSIKRERQLQQGRKFDDGNIKISKSKNVQLAQTLGTQIQVKEPLPVLERRKKRQQARQNLFRQQRQATIGTYLQQIDFEQEEKQVSEKGQKVYIFPFITNKKLKENQFSVFENVIDEAIKNDHQIKISSGYMNFPKDLVERLSKAKKPVQILCSSPEANSFFRAGGIKKYIPSFYRVFEAQLLQKYGDKFKLKEFIRASWSFHAKGVWIKQNENSYTTILGSSNYNERSRERDTELQLYLHSTCPQFNKRLDREYANKEEGCKQAHLQDLYKDQQTKCKGVIRFWATLFSRFL